MRCLLVAFVGLAALAIPQPAEAFCRMSTAEGQCCNPDDSGCSYLRWTRPCIGYNVETSGAQDFSDVDLFGIIDLSFQSWLVVQCAGGGTTGLSVRRLEGASRCDTPEFNQDAGNVNSIMFLSDWLERGNDPNAFALTTVWHNTETGEIFDSDMEINELKGPYGDCAPSGCTAPAGQPITVDLQNVITHEAGHFLGLGHTEVPTASMFARSPPGEITRRFVRPDDQLGYCATYPDPMFCSGNADDFTPRNGLSLDCGGPGSGGCSCDSVDDSHRGIWVGALSLMLGVAWLRRRRGMLR